MKIYFKTQIISYHTSLRMDNITDINKLFPEYHFLGFKSKCKLIDVYEISHDNDELLTQLMFCAKYNIKKYIQPLIDAGADVNIQNNYGQTALFYATNTDVVYGLIKAGADVNILDKGNCNALMQYLNNNTENGDKYCSERIIQLFVEAGLNLNNVNDEHESLLHMYLENNPKTNSRIVKMLTKPNPDTNLNIKNEGGVTPIMILCGGITDTDVKLVKYLIDSGADINIRDRDGDTLLSQICKFTGDYRYENIVKLLIETGADVNNVNKHGYTPIMNYIKFCDYYNKHIIQHLIDAGAKLNVYNKKDKNTLFTLFFNKDGYERPTPDLIDKEAFNMLIMNGLKIKFPDFDSVIENINDKNEYKIFTMFMDNDCINNQYKIWFLNTYAANDDLYKNLYSPEYLKYILPIIGYKELYAISLHDKKIMTLLSNQSHYLDSDIEQVVVPKLRLESDDESDVESVVELDAESDVE